METLDLREELGVTVEIRREKVENVQLETKDGGNERISIEVERRVGGYSVKLWREKVCISESERRDWGDGQSVRREGKICELREELGETRGNMLK